MTEVPAFILNSSSISQISSNCTIYKGSKMNLNALLSISLVAIFTTGCAHVDVPLKISLEEDNVVNKQNNSDVAPQVKIESRPLQTKQDSKIYADKSPPGTIYINEIFDRYDDYFGSEVLKLMASEFYNSKKYSSFWRSVGIDGNDVFAKNDYEKKFNEYLNGGGKTNKSLPQYVLVEAEFKAAQKSYIVNDGILIIGPLPNRYQDITLGAALGYSKWPYSITGCYAKRLFDKSNLLGAKNPKKIGSLNMNISAIVLGKIKVGVDQAKLAFAGRQ